MANRPHGRHWLLIVSIVVLAGVVAGGTSLAFATGLFGTRSTPAARPRTPRSTSSPRPKPSPSPAASPTPTPAIGGSAQPLPGGGDKPVGTVASGISLTVDDGPSPEWTPKYLALFRRLHIKAVFCLIGENVRENPGLVKQIVADGHQLCDHTMEHDESLGDKSSTHIKNDIEQDAQLITKASGGVRPPFFRQPGGTWNKKILRASRELGMTPLNWSVDPRDWAKPGISHITKEMESAKSGDIILCHDGGGNRAQTYAALKKALPYLLNNGATFVLPAMEKPAA